MDYEHLVVEAQGPALWVTMNRPERLNALNPRLVDELRHLFTDLYWKKEVRVVVLKGAGRGFCAGLDLKARGDGSNAKRSVSDGLTGQRKISEIVMAMRRCPQPIIACVNGPASGGGFALALASPMCASARRRTRMNAAFIRIGLSACDIGVSLFPAAHDRRLGGIRVHADRPLHRCGARARAGIAVDGRRRRKLDEKRAAL